MRDHLPIAILVSILGENGQKKFIKFIFAFKFGLNLISMPFELLVNFEITPQFCFSIKNYGPGPPGNRFELAVPEEDDLK